MKDPAIFAEKTTEQVRPLEKAFYLAEWEAAVTGSKEATERVREAQAEYMRFWSDPELFQAAKRMHETGRQCYYNYRARVDGRSLSDKILSARFGVEQGQLRPWHYGDRFFQDGPQLGEGDLDSLVADRDIEKLAVSTYDGLGMDVGSILSRSGLYPRPGKNQHAFCIHVDREGDIRTLNNLFVG